MQKHYPKYEKRLQQDLTNRELSRTTGREGIIIAYNEFRNTATVLLTNPQDGGVGVTVENVPCPTYMGIQIAAPEPGRSCWVEFKNSGERNPIITHFYNLAYSQFDYENQMNASSMIPNYYTSI